MRRSPTVIAEGRTVRAKFVDSALRSLKPHKVKYDIHDPAGEPLVLRVLPDGRKTWLASYRAPDGVPQLRTIGKYPQMSIAEARAMARKVAAGERPPHPPG
jgi:hypothetical protein